MKSKFLLPLSLLVLAGNTQARPNYSQAKVLLENAPSEIKSVMENAPEEYLFPSRFNAKDSASYTGQIFRQVVRDDLKTFMGTLKRSAYQGNERTLVNVLNSFYKFNSNAALRGKGAINGTSRHGVKPKTINGSRASLAEGTVYNAIQNPGKNLASKTAGNDNALRRQGLKGWNTMVFNGVDLRTIDADRQGDSFVEPEDLIQAFFKIVAKNATTGQAFTVPNGSLDVQRITYAPLTKDGVDLTQMVHKFIQGAVGFSQAAGDYLSTDLGSKKGLNADNSKPYKEGKNYTALEHFWDEGFGYFGAARDYLLYTDIEIASKLSIDSNTDGKISILSEKNVGGSATNAARMDYIAESMGIGGLDLTNEVMTAFIAGRELIAKRPTGYLKYAQANATVALAAWEKTLAAVSLHYLNSTLAIMDAYGTSKYLFKNHGKFWSEMKGFSMAFQFNPTALISAQDFDKFHALIGDKPVLMTAPASEIAQYKANLLEAKELLRKAYGFSKANTDIF